MFGNIFLDMFNSIADGVYYVNSNTRIEYWNRGAEILTGLAARDVRGKKCEDVLRYEDATGLKLPAYEYPAVLCAQSSRDIIKDLAFLTNNSEKRFIEEHSSPV